MTSPVPPEIRAAAHEAAAMPITDPRAFTASPRDLIDMALDAAYPLIIERERERADQMSLGGMAIEVAVHRTVKSLGITAPEWRLRLLRDLYRAGVVSGAEISRRFSGKPEPEAVTAIRADERGRVAGQIAAAIERVVCEPGGMCADRFCPDCIRHAQAIADADLARKIGAGQ